MPLHYEIETDDLYLEGIEKGIEKGASKTVRNLVIRMLQMGKLSKEEIALIADVDIAYVNELEKSLRLGDPSDLK